MINSYKIGGHRYSKGAVICMLTIGILNLIMGVIFVVQGNVVYCEDDWNGFQHCYRLYVFIIAGAFYIAVAIVLIIMSAIAFKNPVPITPLTQQSVLYNVNYPQTGQVYNGVQANQASVSMYSTNGGAPQGGIMQNS